MSALTALAVLLGLLLGVGLWVVLARLPFMRRPSFTDRIEPQLRAVASGSKLLQTRVEAPTLFGPLERLARVLVQDVGARLGRFSVGNRALARRLARAGRPQTPVEFRAEQLIWASLGLVVGIVLAVLVSRAFGFNLALALVLAIGCAVLGFALRDYFLGVQIKRRESRILVEFPSLAELMALAVSAGESATGALSRVCNASHGELAREFAVVLSQTRAGMPLTQALADFAQRTNLAPLIRFTDGIIVAVERGTPLADVLRAQAQDVRDLSKRELMESAGRKEIGMMIPLVFGVLPVTVIFAAYPGFQLLTLTLGQ